MPVLWVNAIDYSPEAPVSQKCRLEVTAAAPAGVNEMCEQLGDRAGRLAAIPSLPRTGRDCSTSATQRAASAGHSPMTWVKQGLFFPC